jgi:MYXO-CTERM domain-containing protein
MLLALSTLALASDHDILMLGNSYTQFNDLAQVVEGVTEQGLGVEIEALGLTQGGQTLAGHWALAQEDQGPWSEELSSGEWEWVILQDQSQVPGFPKTHSQWQDSRDGACGLHGMVNEAGGAAVLMLTWGRLEGDAQNPDLYPDFSTMQERLTEGYLAYSEACSDEATLYVAPVGLAWARVHDDLVAAGEDPTDDGSAFHGLYNPDGSHPSAAGSSLAAWAIYASLTGRSPVGLSALPDLEHEGLYQEAARAAVLDEPFGAIPLPFATRWDGSGAYTAGGGHMREHVLATEGSGALTLDDAVFWIEGSFGGGVRGEGELWHRSGTLTLDSPEQIVLEGPVVLDGEVVLDRMEPGALVRATSIDVDLDALVHPENLLPELYEEDGQQVRGLTGVAPDHRIGDSALGRQPEDDEGCSGCATGGSTGGLLGLLGLVLLARRRA